MKTPVMIRFIVINGLLTAILIALGGHRVTEWQYWAVLGCAVGLQINSMKCGKTASESDLDAGDSEAALGGPPNTKSSHPADNR